MKEVVGGGNLTQAQLRTHVPLDVSSLVSDPAALIRAKRTRRINGHDRHSGNTELFPWTLLNIYIPPHLVNVWHRIDNIVLYVHIVARFPFSRGKALSIGEISVPNK